MYYALEVHPAKFDILVDDPVTSPADCAIGCGHISDLQAIPSTLDQESHWHWLVCHHKSLNHCLDLAEALYALVYIL
jgi:hypothetical protein